MPVVYTCLCANINFSFANIPVPTTPNADVCKLTEIEKYGQAEMSVAGVNKVQEILVDTREACGWRITRCLNCSMDCILSNTQTNSTAPFLLTNLALVPKLHESDASSAPLDNYHYSPVFGIKVEFNADVANSLLDAPEVMDERAVELFQHLQKLVDSNITQHSRIVQEKIKRFEREQKEGLKDYLMNAYRDRKILWHKLCEHLNREAQQKKSIGRKVSAPSTVSTTAVSTTTVPPTTTTALPTPTPAPSSISGELHSAAQARETMQRSIRASSSLETTSTGLVSGISMAEEGGAPILAPVAALPKIGTGRQYFAQSSTPSSPSTSGHSTEKLAMCDNKTPRFAVLAPAVSILGNPERNVFRLEEEEVDGSKNENVEMESEESEVEQEEPPGLRPRAAAAIARTMTEPEPREAMLYGTSVPISIPFRHPIGEPAADTNMDISFDVPLSSTQRIKGYL